MTTNVARFSTRCANPTGQRGANSAGKGALTSRQMAKPTMRVARMAHDQPGFEGQFVLVPRSPVATHEQFGLFGKVDTMSFNRVHTVEHKGDVESYWLGVYADGSASFLHQRQDRHTVAARSLDPHEDGSTSLFVAT